MTPSSRPHRALRLLALPAAAALLALVGCAALEAKNDESLLSAAGFRTASPVTPQQQAFYDGLSPFEVQRETVRGKVIYTYADKKKGIIYFGGQQEYQRYQQLGLQQSIAEENLMASEMDEQASLDWNVWGPMGVW